jgi:cellulose synthase/poly-beta-1,6-N-acetylglucosamine synthase-like glycosyltransferase
MELVARLHRLLSKQKRPYRITYVPDPICWTEAPEDIFSLARQRMRWQRGLAESLFMNFSLFLNPMAGAAGLVAFPFFLIFEFLGPVLEIFGYFLVTIGFLLGYISTDVYFILLASAITLGTLLSFAALLLEEISFHIYQRPRDLLLLALIVIVENLGFRQINSIWRILGTFKWLYRIEQNWGDMVRRGHWH